MFIKENFQKIFLILLIRFILFVVIIGCFFNTICIYGNNASDITTSIHNSVSTTALLEPIDSVSKKNISDIIRNGAKIQIKSHDVPNEKNKLENLKEPFRRILRNDYICDDVFKDILFEKIDDNHVKLSAQHDSQNIQGTVTLERIEPHSDNIISNDKNNSLFLKKVCGYEDVKKELKHIADYIQKKDIYDQIGASLPRGYILYGPPGTGKTYFAKQLSEELQIPFIYRSGPEFQDQYIGEGNKKVRELFQEAESLNQTCIIFIDEIDAVASKRGNGDDVGTQSHNALVNQFLTELDGFKNRKHPIIVIGATNKVDLLDAAMTRSGRLEKKILIDLPSKEDCYKICSMYFNEINLDDSLKNNGHIKKDFLTEIVNECFDSKFSSASFKRLANDAALLAVRKGKTNVDKIIVHEALHKIQMGFEKERLKPKDLSSLSNGVLIFGQKFLLIIGIIFFILGFIVLCLNINRKNQKRKILQNL